VGAERGEALGHGALTARERQVAFAVAAGLTNKAIARQFGVSTKTVEFHLGNVFRKLHVVSRVQLVNALRTTSPSPHIAIHPGNGLPVHDDAMFGRDELLETTVAAIGRQALVTLAGVGGVGKTRLAVEAVRRTGGEFEDGVWFVDLATITDAAHVLGAVVDMLRVQPAWKRPSPEGLAETLGLQRRLVLLDNCEHVLEAVCPLVEALVARCPRLVLLATSRERLGTSREFLVAVPPVSCDRTTESSPAAMIFAQRARSTGRTTELDDGELDDVHEICARLDGIPLAIELAAGRLGGLSVAQIKSRLDDRFALLVTRGAAVERQLSLQRAVAWSFDLLSEGERDLLAALSVFTGDFNVDAAVAVAPPGEPTRRIEDRLASLVEKSLVSVSDRSDRRRYVMLETVREFAAASVTSSGGLEPARRRHLDHFRRVARDLDAGIRNRDEPGVHRAMADDWHNLRLAVSSACDMGDGVAACEVVRDVLWWALTRRRTEVGDWATRAEACPSSIGHPARTVALAARAYFANVRGDPATAVELLAAARAHERLYGELDEPWITVVETFWADDQLSTTLETQRRARRIGSSFWELLGAMQEAVIHAFAINHTETMSADERSTRLSRIVEANRMAEEYGNLNGIAYGAANLGEAVSLEDPDTAERLITRAIATAEELELGLLAGQARRALAVAWLRRDQYADALAVIATALRESARSGSFVEVDAELGIAAAVCEAWGLRDLAHDIRAVTASPTTATHHESLVALARRVIAVAAEDAAVQPTSGNP
jgi:predicted ATPase/DNA-binding CsgD family transcriptional regulator